MSSATHQPVDTPLTQAAMFLVLTLNTEQAECLDTVRAFCADLSGLLRSVGFRDQDGRLTCILGFGSDAWDHLFGAPRPNELHSFQEIQGVHHAVSTPGDMLLHIRATRMDLCFELATQITTRLGAAATVVDEVHGFKYFDARDLIGFVDGTENPDGPEATAATVVGDEDSAFAGGSYVIVQKYLHDLAGWNALPVEMQEKIIGRTKQTNIELADDVKPSWAHNALTVIEEDGEELDIVRDNMPFGEVGKGEFGTYFIGYAKSPSRIERMLENMFIGRPPGNYDRLLDYSRAVTGSLFFVPASGFLDDAPENSALPSSTELSPSDRTGDGSLGIGSLKGEAHE
ncbi:Dye-decolorizing peroxidase YfeX [Castellaniella defragrans]